ncbi:hypothetical protein M0R72_17925 [Candidatus Pacearchaeota archaeon]|jgi:hypothetical protein|nr:hypothetical protein [Candidatus Pacearchaeota archaeon]
MVDLSTMNAIFMAFGAKIGVVRVIYADDGDLFVDTSGGTYAIEFEKVA